MRTALHQLRLAARALVRARGFAATATLTLALGIGLSTAVFTVADALLLRRLPVVEQERLVLLWGETHDGRFANVPLALDDGRDFARASRSLAEVAYFAFRGATPTPVEAGGRLQPVHLALVSGNFFDVLGSPAAIGRTLRPDDDLAGAAPVVVLAHRAWRERFGGDSTIVGRTMTMAQSGRAATIVGVMPPGLEYPHGTEAWAPVVATGAAGGFLEIVTGELDLLARLRPGASAARAGAELTTFLGRPDAPPRYREVRGVAFPLADVVLGDTKPAVLLVTVAAALLLLVTCVNVANLLLVRALGRVRELAVRSALGASRGRLVAQLLAESALLALAGGLLGTALAVAAVRVFVALAPAGLPRLDEIGVSGATLGAAILVTTLAMLLSGLGPALFSSRVRAQEALRSGGRHGGGRRVRRAAEALVVVQIALAAVSLAAAGLVTRSLVALHRVDLAFAPERLLVATLALRSDRIAGEAAERAALDAVLAGARALPGVRAVTPVTAVPFVGMGGGVDGRLSTPEQGEAERDRNPMVSLEVAAPDHFAMLGMPVLQGRAFTDADRDGAVPVVVVSESVARHFWPDADPIGRQLGGPGRPLTVVGVVPDTRYRELRTARPTVYLPLAQGRFPVPSTLLVRTTGAPAALVPALRRAVAGAHPGVAVASATPLETLLAAPRAQPRLNAAVLALFAAAALSLAAIGLFAVVATMVRQRTRELGIRLALGATAGQVRRLVLGRGLALALAGAAIGMAGVLAAGRLLSALLFEVAPTDGPTLLAVAAVLLAVAAAATALPAWAGARIEPATVLRGEE